VAFMVVDSTAAGFMVVRLFTVAASEAADSMAAGFAAVMFSTAVAFATAASRFGIITGTSTMGTMGRPIITTRTTAAESSGPITVRAASVTSATGITGITGGTIADTGELRSDG
jgi:hypothetical protein